MSDNFYRDLSIPQSKQRTNNPENAPLLIPQICFLSCQREKEVFKFWYIFFMSPYLWPCLFCLQYPSSLREDLYSNSKNSSCICSPTVFCGPCYLTYHGMLALGLVTCVCIWNRLWAVSCRDHILFLSCSLPPLIY